jgi:hypothetical protein
LAENWKISKRVRKTHQLSPSKYHPIKKFSNSLLIFLVASNMFMPKLFDQTPPSYLKWARLFLSKSDNGSQLSPFPYIASVTNRIVLCTKVKKKTKSIYSSKKKSFSFLRLIYIPECQMYI